MPNKRYTAFNRQNFLLVVNVPGTTNQMSIEFSGGYGMSSEAYFFTNDIDVQNMLESDPRFNEKFRLTEIDNVPIAEYNARKEIKAAKKEVVQKVEVKPEVVQEAKTEAEVIPAAPKEVVEKVAVKRNVFKNMQDARNYFASELKVPFHLTNNKQKLKEKAAELGVNIVLESDNK